MRTPKTIFARVEQDGDEEYLLAGRTLDEITPAEDGQFVVMEYQLVCRHKAERSAKFIEPL